MSAPGGVSAAQSQDEGRLLLTAFYAALRALKFYPVENVTVQQALQDLHHRTAELLARDGAIEIRVVGDFFFVNETRLRLDLANYSVFGSFARTLHGHDIGAVEILAGMERTRRDLERRRAEMEKERASAERTTSPAP